MNGLLGNLSGEQLRRAAKIKDRIDSLQSELDQILSQGQGSGGRFVTSRRRHMSAAGLARIRAAQKARWARFRQARGRSAGPTRRMPAAAKARFAAVARERWRKARAAGRNKL